MKLPISACLLLTLLSACQTNSPHLLPQAATTQLGSFSQSRAIPQLNTQVFKSAIAVQVLADRLIFEGQHSFQQGQVLMGRSSQNVDFLRRVRSSRFDGKQTQVETQAANLFDAYQELDVSTSQSKAPERISIQQQRIQFGQFEMLVDLGIQADFSKTRIRLKDKQLLIEMAPRFEIDTRIQNSYRFDSLASTLAPELKPVGKFAFTAANFPLWVGPIPLIFKVKPGAALEMAQSAQGNLKLATQVEGSFQPSLKLEARLGETPRIQSDLQEDFTAKVSPLQANFTGETRARVHLPQISLDSKIAGLIGPYLETGTYIDTQWSRRPQSNQIQESIRSQLGLSIYGGLSAGQLFGKELASQLRIKIVDRDLKEIYRQDHLIPAEALNVLSTR